MKSWHGALWTLAALALLAATLQQANANAERVASVFRGPGGAYGGLYVKMPDGRLRYLTNDEIGRLGR